jgi:hypothetical protein
LPWQPTWQSPSERFFHGRQSNKGETINTIRPNISIEQTTARRGRIALLLAAGGSLGVAALHVAIPLIGTEAYRFFGAPNMAEIVEAGVALRAALITFSLAAIFAVWGLYALSGAGVLRRLPLLRLGLLVIGGIYTLRGLLLIQEIIASIQGKMREPQYFMWFSVVSLVIGIFYLTGTIRAWKDLSLSNSKLEKN